MGRLRPVIGLIISLSLFLGTLSPVAINHTPALASPPDPGRPQLQPTAATPSDAAATVYLPLMIGAPPNLVPGSGWISPFGVQPYESLTNASRLSSVTELGVGWVRLSDRVSWRALQPNEGDAINWDLLAGFEQELRALDQAGITPVININYFPLWATVGPDACGAIRPDKLPAFASFVAAVVARYQGVQFNVHHWEIGNEPDVDPSIAGGNSHWGCWGDIADPFYGGRAYGEMLKVVGPAIKAADPDAKVWIGGLLLNGPDNTSPKVGRPELFLQGILEAGAAPYFDVVAYHVYAYYREPLVDFDTAAGGPWQPWGGRVVGKARFLKQIMAQYNVEKPLVADEMGLIWCPSSQGCPPPGMQFYYAQATFVVRSVVRGIGAGVQGFFWYALEWPGFRFSSLLYQDGSRKPIYYAYQQLASQLAGATYLGPVDYGAGVEAYAFSHGSGQVHVIWAAGTTPLTISLPLSSFVAAFDLYGAPIEPGRDQENVYLNAGYNPIYVEVGSQNSVVRSQ